MQEREYQDKGKDQKQIKNESDSLDGEEANPVCRPYLVQVERVYQGSQECGRGSFLLEVEGRGKANCLGMHQNA